MVLTFLEELGGFFVMLNTTLEGTEVSNSGDFTGSNDFRKITLIKELITFERFSRQLFSTLRATYVVKIASSINIEHIYIY